MFGMFAIGPGDWCQSQVESYQIIKKWYLIPLLLNTQRYKVSGAIQGKE